MSVLFYDVPFRKYDFMAKALAILSSSLWFCDHRNVHTRVVWKISLWFSLICSASHLIDIAFWFLYNPHNTCDDSGLSISHKKNVCLFTFGGRKITVCQNVLRYTEAQGCNKEQILAQFSPEALYFQQVYKKEINFMFKGTHCYQMKFTLQQFTKERWNCKAHSSN